MRLSENCTFLEDGENRKHFYPKSCVKSVGINFMYHKIGFRMGVSTMICILILGLMSDNRVSAAASEADNKFSVGIYTDKESQDVEKGDNGFVHIWLNSEVNQSNNFSIELWVNHSANNDGVLKVQQMITLSTKRPVKLPFNCVKAGNAKIWFTYKNPEDEEEEPIEKLDEFYIHVNVIRSSALDIVSEVIGWIYFVAWSISFYPQVFDNFRRRSVVGLNFDFLAYNFLGFSVYSAFNIGLFWVSTIRSQYHKKHPSQLIPVKLNDVIFSIHAAFITLVTIGQCFIFKRNNQRVSWFCWIFIACSLIIIAVLAVIAGVRDTSINGLDFLYWIAYIKLVISFIKYLPQAYMNYKRQSTVGWSIGNVILDFTGGLFSILQALLISYNSDDWPSLYADPVKFGLGFLSIFFDIFFMIQHYVLYRHNREEDEMLDGISQEYKVLHDAADDTQPLFNPGSRLSNIPT